jgi:hypothetical protein
MTAVRPAAAEGTAPASRTPSSPVEMEEFLRQTYPTRARSESRSGAATVEALVLSNGQIGSTRVVSETEAFGFGSACARALTLSSGRWRPATDASGTPIAMNVQYRCDYRIALLDGFDTKNEERAAEVKVAHDKELHPFSKPRIPTHEFGIFIRGGGLLFDAATRDRYNVGSPAGAELGLEGVLQKFMFVAIGIGLVRGADLKPFRETACGASGCRTDSSSTTGDTFWAQAGPHLGVLIPAGEKAVELGGFLGLGARGLSLSRIAEHGGTCLDCRAPGVKLNTGVFLSPRLDVAYPLGRGAAFEVIGANFAYERYFTGAAQHGFWAGIFAGHYWL